MEDETKFRLDDIDRKITALDRRIDDQTKRFDDVKWFAGGSAIIFASLAAIAGWNLNSERQGLRDFQKEVREQVAKIDDTTLTLYGTNLIQLSGQDVEASLERWKGNARSEPDGDPYLILKFVLRNEGDSSSGPVFMKLYTKEGLRLYLRSSDEQLYAYEDYATPDTLKPNAVPGKMSVTHHIRFYLPPPVSIAQGKHPALLKVYYGRGKIASAAFSLVTNSAMTSQ